VNVDSIGPSSIKNNLHRLTAAALEICRNAGDSLPDARIDMIIAKPAISAKLEIFKTAAEMHRFPIDIFA